MHLAPAVEVVGDLWPFSLMACWKSDGAVWALSLDETVESTLFHQGGSEVTETDTSGDGTVWAWQITFCCYVATRCLSVTQQTNAAVTEMPYDYLCGRRFFFRWAVSQVNSYRMKCHHFILIVFNASKHGSMAPGWPSSSFYFEYLPLQCN